MEQKPTADEEKIVDTILKIEDRAKRRRPIKHLPIDIMEAKGKDPVEAALFVVIDELIENARYKSSSPYGEKERDDKKAKRYSLIAVFSRVAELFSHADKESVYFYDPRVAALASRRNELIREWVGLNTKIRTALGRRSGFVRRFEEANDELNGIDRDLALVTGFAVGIRAAQEAMRENQEQSRMTQFEKFSIGFPAEPKVETKASA